MNRRATRSAAWVLANYTEEQLTRIFRLYGDLKQAGRIARAIVNNPQILFADEPTGNLDSATGEKVIKLLFDLNKKKHVTLIIVTHDEDLAKLCDRQIRISDGRIVNGSSKKSTKTSKSLTTNTKATAKGDK